MRRFRLFLALVVLTLCSHGTAFAQTFVSTSGDIFNYGFDAGDLLVRFTESGVQPSAMVAYTVTGAETATYACVAGKTGVELPPVLEGEGILRGFSLTASSKGTINQAVGIDESDPSASDISNCPRGSRIVLWKVQYTNIEINDVTNIVASPVGGGSFSLTFCNLNRNPQNCPPQS
jgi:hypothetical protein